MLATATTAWEMFGHERTARAAAWSAGGILLQASSLAWAALPDAPPSPRSARRLVRAHAHSWRIEVAWERDEERFGIGVTLPDSVRADVILPCDAEEFAEPGAWRGVIEVVRRRVWEGSLATGRR